MKKKISIIIPVFNNQDTLKELYITIIKTLKKIFYIDYRIIFVDDCSIDNSREILKI